jgi:hypothetical protein
VREFDIAHGDNLGFGWRFCKGVAKGGHLAFRGLLQLPQTIQP